MFCNQLRICFFLVIYLAVILTRTTSNHGNIFVKFVVKRNAAVRKERIFRDLSYFSSVTSCSGDKSSRNACPSSQSEANFKSSCERYSCCWDATTNGVPWCFYSTGGKPNDLPVFHLSVVEEGNRNILSYEMLVLFLSIMVADWC